MALAPRSTGAIAQSLRGIDFPCDRGRLIEHARGNKADREIIDVLEQMPDERYTSMADVFRGVRMSDRH